MRIEKTFIHVILLILSLNAFHSKEVMWNTSLGLLIGSVRTSLSGYEYYSFEGIPFAKPPVGALRFKAPVPAGPWNKVLNATHKAPHCYEFPNFMSPEIYKQSEDCLYLNIYTRTLNKNPTNNVLFAIYGGSYVSGNTDNMGADYFTDEEDLIFVTSNYRLNIFGFLSLKDSSLQIPGNAGAKDVLAALQWVQNNIREFGGNPDKVTTIGCSSAGHLINLLMLHPLGSKLFRHAISQSGSAILSEVVVYDNIDHQLAQMVGFRKNISDKRDFFDHINSFSGIELVEALTNYKNKVVERKLWFIFGIVVESPFDNPTSFLLEMPDILIKKGAFARIPYLTSFTFQEGNLYEREMTSIINNNYTDLLFKLPEWLLRSLHKTELHSLNEEVEKMYYKNKKPSIANNYIALNIAGDLIFLYPNLLTWRVMATAANFSSPIYLYFFNYTSALNIIQYELDEYRSIFGPYYNHTCIHCDETGYIYSNTKFNVSTIHSFDDYDTILKLKTLKRIIMNFVRTGNPSSQDVLDPTSKFDWKPLHSRKLLDMNYLVVEYPELSMGKLSQSIFAKRMIFWNNIFKRYKDYETPFLSYFE